MPTRFPSALSCTGCLLRCAARLARGTVQALAALAVVAATMLWPAPTRAADPPLHLLRLPPGFSIELFAQVPGARGITLGAGNTVYVGSFREGRVYALNYDAAYRAGPVRVLAEDLRAPVGVAYRDGALYVSAVDRILRLPGIDGRLDDPPRPELVTDRLPNEMHHGWKFIAFGPDGWLYVPVGAPCNVCERDPDRFATILRMRPDGSRTEVFARGVRNSVGFDWHPQTRELWFTDNGRDYLGDDSPPCELNHAPRPGMHFGFPYCHGVDTRDPEFGARHACSTFTPVTQPLGAHVAPLGMRFYTGRQFPPEYRGAVFVAEHGSWNRSRRSGFRVTVVRLEGNRPVSYTPFLEGWLWGKDGQEHWGRPADVQMLPDGSLLVSDDQAGVLYRITYKGAASGKGG